MMSKTDRYGQTKADRKAMLEDSAAKGRMLMKRHNLNAAAVSSMFAAIMSAQRKIIMENYRKDGTEK